MISSVPSVLIYEYCSGGGWPETQLPEDLTEEGLAMLQAVLADFRDWGGAKITTTRDPRLPHISLPADRVITLDAAHHFRVLAHLAEQCTAALIIAPESNGILARLSALMQSRGVRLLGSNPDSVAASANKWVCYKRFLQAGLPTPDTWCIDVRGAVEKAKEIGFPLVIKPIDGVGCKGVSMIRDVSSLQMALEKDRDYGKQLLLQRYVEGVHASVSLLVAGRDILCLSLNKQFIEVGTPFIYRGGEVPFMCDQYEAVLGSAMRAVSLVPGLRGYVGVDILLTDEGCQIIEINPRLTTAYVGLRRVVNINLAEAIWEAFINDVLPANVSLSGSATFSTKKESEDDSKTNSRGN